MTSREEQERLWRSQALILSSTERIDEIVNLRWMLERKQKHIQQLESSARENAKTQLELTSKLEEMKRTFHIIDLPTNKVLPVFDSSSLELEYCPSAQSRKNGSGIGLAPWHC